MCNTLGYPIYEGKVRAGMDSQLHIIRNLRNKGKLIHQIHQHLNCVVLLLSAASYLDFLDFSVCCCCCVGVISGPQPLMCTGVAPSQWIHADDDLATRLHCCRRLSSPLFVCWRCMQKRRSMCLWEQGCATFTSAHRAESQTADEIWLQQQSHKIWPFYGRAGQRCGWVGYLCFKT